MFLPIKNNSGKEFSVLQNSYVTKMVCKIQAWIDDNPIEGYELKPEVFIIPEASIWIVSVGIACGNYVTLKALQQSEFQRMFDSQEILGQLLTKQRSSIVNHIQLLESNSKAFPSLEYVLNSMKTKKTQSEEPKQTTDPNQDKYLVACRHLLISRLQLWVKACNDYYDWGIHIQHNSNPVVDVTIKRNLKTLPTLTARSHTFKLDITYSTSMSNTEFGDWMSSYLSSNSDILLTTGEVNQLIAEARNTNKPQINEEQLYKRLREDVIAELAEKINDKLDIEFEEIEDNSLLKKYQLLLKYDDTVIAYTELPV